MSRAGRSPRADPAVRVLYISYDGLTDPLGQSQILPYLAGCAEAGHRLTIVSFEKDERLALLGEQVRGLVEAHGMEWRPERFRPSPPLVARALDQMAMRRSVERLAREQRFDLVHARSYPAAVAGLRLKRRHGVPLLFDMRGFWPDSRRDGGRWSERSLLGRTLYRRWKAHERALLRESDHIVAMADAARAAIRTMPGYAGAPVSVIPCCTDFELFDVALPEQRREARAALGIAEDALVLVYVGSLGTIYRLEDQLRLFDKVRLRRAGARLLFIGRHRKADLLAAAGAAGIALGEEEVSVVAAERAEIGRWISAGDVGTCFYTPAFSSLNVSPTKLAEYLACGVPAIGNCQVGDVARLLERCRGGMTVDDFSDAALERAAEAVLELATIDRTALRERARPLLDLPHAVAAYRSLYERLDRPVTVG